MALACAVVISLISVAGGGRALGSADKRAVVGYVTQVSNQGVLVGRTPVPPGGASGYRARYWPLRTGDALRAKRNASAEYYVRVGKSYAYCDTSPADGYVQVHPAKSKFLLKALGGSSLCGTLPTNQDLIGLGSYGTIHTGSDPILKISVGHRGSVVKVRRGVAVVAGHGGLEDAVVLGRDAQTVVAPGQKPASPTQVPPPTGAEQKGVGQLASKLPPVQDVPAPTTTVSGPPNPSSIRAAEFTFTSDQEGTTFSCALDSTDFRLCTSPQTYTGLTPGQHELVVRATNTAGKSSEQPVQWVVDRSVIAFESTRDGHYQVYTVNPDGTGQTNISRSGDDDKDPSWSADGSRLAFQRALPNNGDTNIYVMNGDGSGQKALTQDRYDGNPSWSPDGSAIAFESTRTGFSEIYTMRSDGSGQRGLTSDKKIATDAAWSPDGTRIAFASTLNGSWQIFVANTDGSDRRLLSTPGSIPGRPFDELGPAWSPDGRRLAFYSKRDTDNYQIYTMNPDGSDVRRVTSSKSDDTNPSWAPDGRELAFQRLDGQTNDIYFVNAADGSGLTQVTGAGVSGDGLVPSWGRG